MQYVVCPYLNCRTVNSGNDSLCFWCFQGSPYMGVTFIDKVESCCIMKFLRLTFLSSLTGKVKEKASGPMTLTYKTFIPAPLEVGMCSGSLLTSEDFPQMWERAKKWLDSVGESGCLTLCSSMSDWVSVDLPMKPKSNNSEQHPTN